MTAPARHTEVRVIEASDLPALLSMTECIELVDDCMRQVAAGNVELPLRWGLRAGAGGAMGMMPGYLGEPECFGIKLVSLFPGNVAAGLSSHAGLMILFEPRFGQPVAMLDAGYLTALRTGAASAVATRALARDDAEVVAILGTGEQAAVHAEAMRAVLPHCSLRIWGRNQGKAQALATQLEAAADQPVPALSDVTEALRGADVVCTVTASSEPLFCASDLSPGCHVNAVGASMPPQRELDAATVLGARYFVDYRASALAQAAELIDGIAAGQLDESHIAGEIGAVLAGDCPGRQTAEQFTIYRSLGVAAQDLAAAQHIYRRAAARGVGQMARIS